MSVRLGIVCSEFNFNVTYLMLELAKEHAKFLKAEIRKIVMVPGAFDMPLAVKKLLERDDIDAVVALGAIIEGETEHDEVIGHQVARKLMDLSVEYGKPVALGISGPGMTMSQALERVDYAKRAVEAAVKMVERIREAED